MGFSDDVLPILLAFYELFKAILLWPFPKSKKDLNGEVVLITGAGSGIGAGLAKKMADMGCVVVCWDVNVAGNDATVDFIRKAGGQAYGFKCDVTNREEVYEVTKKSTKLAGDITILVNNAGIVGGKTFLELDDRIIQKTFEVNAISHFWTTKAVLPKMMEKNHGHIVSIASSAGYFGAPRMTDYCSSKAAAAHFADSLSMEMYKANSDVKVTWICPYAIDTGMFSGFNSKRSYIVDMLTPEQVVDDIVYSIQTNADRVFLPGGPLNLSNILQTILPRRANLIMNEWGGVMGAMDTFTGRQKKD